MKKMLSIMLALFMSATAFGNLCFAEDPIVKTSQDIYGWTRVDSGYDYDDTNSIYDTVNVVADPDYGYAMKSVKQSASHSNSWKGIKQRVSASKLISGHTYKLDYKFKMLKTPTWIKVGFNHTIGTTKYYSEPYGSNSNEQWGSRSNTIPYNSTVLTNGLEVIFYNTNGVGTFWIADVKLYDTADAEQTNLISNGDFTQSIQEHNNNYLYGWDVRHSGSEYDFDKDTKTQLDYIDLVHNADQYGSVLLIRKQSVNHSNSWKGVSSTVPAEKLTSGNTYVLEYDMKLSNVATWGRAGFSDSSFDPYGPNCKTWAHYSTEKAYTSGNITAIFYCINSTLDLYIANVTIYDKADPNKTNLLANGDFSHLDTDHSTALYGWQVNNQAQPGDSVRVVDNAKYGTAALIEKKSTRGTDQIIWLTNQIDSSKLVSNQTYVVEYDYMMEPTPDHYSYTGWGGWGTSTYSETYGAYNGTWTTKTNTITYTGTPIRAAFGLTGSAGRLWIANVKVYNQADASKTNLLTNGTFSDRPDFDVDFKYDNGTTTASIYSLNKSLNIMMVSAIYDSTTNELLDVMVNPATVQASSDIQSFYDYPSVWGDGYTTRCFLWNADTMQPLADSLVVE